MITLRELRRRFLAVILALGVLCLACVVYLLLPMNRDSAEKREQVANARLALRQQELQVTPLRGLDAKLVRSKEESAAFYNDRLPDRYSAISQNLNDLAQKQSVQISGITYAAEATDIPDIQQVVMRVTVTGPYARTMDYIDALDHSRIFFLLDDVALQNGENGRIQLQLTLETYLRSNTVPASSGVAQ